jgi:hypothetical protein
MRRTGFATATGSQLGITLSLSWSRVPKRQAAKTHAERPHHPSKFREVRNYGRTKEALPRPSIPSSSDLRAIEPRSSPIFWIGRRTFLIHSSNRLRTYPHRRQQDLRLRLCHRGWTGQQALPHWRRYRRSPVLHPLCRASRSDKPTRGKFGRRQLPLPRMLRLALQLATLLIPPTHCRFRKLRMSRLPPSFASLLGQRVSQRTSLSGRALRIWRSKSASRCGYSLKISCSF